MQVLILVFIGAFLVLLGARNLAFQIGLVDKPNARKKHSGHIPLVGGVSIYLALWVLYALHPDWMPQFTLYMICATILLVVGVLDDRFDLPVLPRVGIQALVAGVMMWSGLYLASLGNVVAGSELVLGVFGYSVTLFAVWGAINAFNMVDGIDGLLGALSCVTFGALSVVFELGGNPELSKWCLCLLVASLPYIMLNLGIPMGKKFKVFMGDAGSTLIGFTVIWLLVLATQGDKAVMQPVSALWVIAVPLMDMATIMVRRIRRGDSPFKPDREHLHHILMRAGLGPRQTLLAIVAFSALLAAVGVICDQMGASELLMLGMFLAVFAGYFWSITRVWKILTLIRKLSHKSRMSEIGSTPSNK